MQGNADLFTNVIINPEISPDVFPPALTHAERGEFCEDCFRFWQDNISSLSFPL